jgi:hypothetical protein
VIVSCLSCRVFGFVLSCLCLCRVVPCLVLCLSYLVLLFPVCFQSFSICLSVLICQETQIIIMCIHKTRQLVHLARSVFAIVILLLSRLFPGLCLIFVLSVLCLCLCPVLISPFCFVSFFVLPFVVFVFFLTCLCHVFVLSLLSFCAYPCRWG